MRHGRMDDFLSTCISMGGPATYTSINNQEHRNSGFSSEYRFFVEGESSIYLWKDLTFFADLLPSPKKNGGQRAVFAYSFFFLHTRPYSGEVQHVHFLLSRCVSHLSGKRNGTKLFSFTATGACLSVSTCVYDSTP